MVDEEQPGRRRQFTKPVALADLSLALEKTATKLTIFVAGPYIEKGWTVQQREAAPAGANLRITLIEHIESMLQHATVLGEHRGVTELGDARLRSRSSALLAELALVEQASAIVVIPSSAGSFCELGSWVLRDDLCAKMLILADIQHQEAVSYMRLGVFKTAADQSAQLEWVDYRDIGRATEIVERFIAKTEDAALSRSLRRGR